MSDGNVDILCQTCKFFNDDDCECRRFPPVTLIYTEERMESGFGLTSQWPVVRPHHWCGEWEGEKP